MKTVRILLFVSAALSTITDHVTKKVTSGPIGSTQMIQLKMVTSKIDRLCLMNKLVLTLLVLKLVQGKVSNIGTFQLSGARCTRDGASGCFRVSRLSVNCS